MKRKGQIILVTMLAAIFMATTVHASGGGWWSFALDKMWYKVEKKIHKLEKKTKRNARKIKHNSRRIKKNARKISRLDRKVDRKHNRWHKKKKHKNNRGSGVDVEAMKADILAALKADAAFTASLKGEPGKDGADGQPGPDRPRFCPGCNFSDTETDMLIGEDFTNAFLFYSWFQGADLTDANFTGANCKEASFLEAVVTGATFDNADLANANMAGADWTGINLAAAKSVKGAEWVYSRYVGYDSSARQSIWEDVIAICPDGTNALNNGRTCEGHLTPLAP